MPVDDVAIIGLTLGCAFLSTLLILPPGIFLAWLLACRQWRGKSVVETLVSLPMVMPPVATGLILLELLGHYGPIGVLLDWLFGAEIVFTWKAVIIAMSVMAFPFLVNSVRLSFEQINPRLEQVARTLGARPWRIFLTITLPLAKRGIVAGMVWAFARALGEFGATILVAGNIPGRTTTLAVAIYSEIQIGNDAHALTLMFVSVGLAFLTIFLSNFFLRWRTNR